MHRSNNDGMNRKRLYLVNTKSVARSKGITTLDNPKEFKNNCVQELIYYRRIRDGNDY